jgi:hypothetical protein
MKNIQEWRHERPVKGTYCGIPYRGRILDNGPFESRMGPRGTFIYVVQLDTPITVFGEQRTQISIWDDSDDSVIAA